MIKTMKKDGKRVKVSVPCKAADCDDYIVFLVDKNGTTALDSHNDRYNDLRVYAVCSVSGTTA